MIYADSHLKSVTARTTNATRKVSATTVQDFWQLLNWLQALPKEVEREWWGNWPTANVGWSHTDKRQPVFFMKQGLFAELCSQHTVAELPSPYANLQITLLRHEFWQKLSSSQPGEQSVIADPYWRGKFRDQINRIRKECDYWWDPSEYFACTPTDQSSSVELIKSINDWIENFDRGQQNRVKLGKTKGLTLEEDVDGIFLKCGEETMDLSENTANYYLLASVTERVRYLLERQHLLPIIQDHEERGWDTVIPELIRQRITQNGSAKYPFNRERVIPTLARDRARSRARTRRSSPQP